MLYFLHPILLWAAAGIIVPVVIHLWNIRQGKTLKVGSIALVTESAKSQASSFRLTQWMLLLLRCLLIIISAMLLAQPFLEQQLHKQEKGWIVVKKIDLKEVYHRFHPIIDSLQGKGYTLHYFGGNFEEGSWKDTLSVTKDTSSASNLSYWTLLKILNEKISYNLPVYLFTDNLLQHFSGDRPAVSLNMRWYTYPTIDTSAEWLAKAYQTTTDSLRTIVGKSNGYGSFYESQNVPMDGADSRYKISREEEKLFISSNDSLTGKLIADTATVTIAIYTKKYFADANYLRAALEAIKDFTQRKIQVKVINNVSDVPVNHNWLFWLSEEVMPASMIKDKVVVYENGNIQNAHSALITSDGTTLTTTNPVNVYQCIQNDTIGYQPVWTNGFNMPVLSMERNRTGIYHLYSHFNPQWSDLVWSHSFPQILYNLLFDEEVNIGSANDKRIIDSSQMQPVIHAVPIVSNRNEPDKKDMSAVFWLTAFCLFLLERIVSFRQTNGIYE